MAGTGTYVLIGVVALAALFGGWYALTYNSLVAADQGVNAKWAAVETQYQRRVDLIPNLVSTVKGTSGFEQETLAEITRLRSQWQTQTAQADRVKTANELETAISKLLLITENYPELKSTQAYADLMVQLEGTENRVAFARNEFNEAVRGYNVNVQSLPNSIVASSMGLKPKEFFQAAKGADAAPTVKFD